MKRLDFLPNHNDIKIYQDDEMIKINTDTQVLGEFIEVYRNDTVLDIGTNTGALLLYASRFNPKMLIGIDINEKALKLCEENMKLNNISNYKILLEDGNTYRGEEVDVCICNPPYFKTKVDNLSKDKMLNLAKHEGNFPLENIIATANKNTKLNGVFYMLFLTSRLQEVMILLNKYHFKVKKLQFVYDDNKENSNIFMVKCVKCGKDGLVCVKPNIIKR